MRVQRAYKTELDLNDQQVTACKQHAGAARWAYNWGLQVTQERYRATKKSPTAIDLHRELNALKKTNVPWMYQVSKCAPQEALWNLDAAFAHFFRRCALKKQGKWKDKLGYPQVKTKKKGLGSFRLTGTIVASDKAMVLDRDLNAAINLAKLAGSLSDSLNACGAESAGSSRKAGVKLSAKRGPRARKKQEQESSYASA
jgi:transposase